MNKNATLLFILPVLALAFSGCSRKQPPQFVLDELATLETDEQSSGERGQGEQNTEDSSTPSDQPVNNETQTNDNNEGTTSNEDTVPLDNENQNVPEDTTPNEDTNTTPDENLDQTTPTEDTPPNEDAPGEDQNTPPEVVNTIELPSEFDDKQKLYFEMGPDGEEPGHFDNGSKKTEYIEDELYICNAENIFPNSRDALGNGCLKIGSTSKDGTFDIDLSGVSGVYKVVLFVADYKAATTHATVSIDGCEPIAVGGMSNEGQYSQIIADVTNPDVMSFAFVKRAMINEIVFILDN